MVCTLLFFCERPISCDVTTVTLSHQRTRSCSYPTLSRFPLIDSFGSEGRTAKMHSNPTPRPPPPPRGLYCKHIYVHIKRYPPTPPSPSGPPLRSRAPLSAQIAPLTTASISSFSFFLSAATGSSVSAIACCSIHLNSVEGNLIFAAAALSANQKTRPGLKDKVSILYDVLLAAYL